MCDGVGCEGGMMVTDECIVGGRVEVGDLARSVVRVWCCCQILQGDERGLLWCLR